MASDLTATLTRLESVTSRLESLEANLRGSATASVPDGPSTAAAPVAAAIPAPSGGAGLLASYDAAVSTAAVEAAAAQLGGEVEQVTVHLVQAFKGQRHVIAVSLAAKQPDASQLQALLQPVAREIMAAGELAEQRRSPCFQHHKTVAEALAGLSWLAYAGPATGLPAPSQHVADCWSAAEFFANKLLMEHRGRDERHVIWVKALKELMAALQVWLRQNWPSGLKWNPGGCSIQQAEAQLAAADGAAPAAAPAATPATAAPAPAAGTRPPPPPPPPPPAGLLLQDRPGASESAPKAAGQSAGAPAGGASMSNVFAELSSKTGGAAAGLRKVTADMKTKNRPPGEGPAPPVRTNSHAAAAPTASQASGTPRVELSRGAGMEKWVVEHQVGNSGVVIEDTNTKQTVYIFGCRDSVVQIKGKVKTIAIDSCTKTGVVFDHVIATVEVVNCSRLQVQCLGNVRTISIDKSDGAQLFLPAGADSDPDFQLVTAKCSEVNVTVAPVDYDTADSKEHAVPEQFISTFQDGRLVTVAASHSAG